MEGIEYTAFQIISYVGTARSLYIQAISEAQAGNLDEARKLIKEGEEHFTQGHHAHFDLIAQEADEERDPVLVNLLLVHAEDQLMSAEGFKIIAEEFIKVYERVLALENK